jgi:hypothetical protein
MTPQAALQMLERLERAPRAESDMLVDCNSETEREALVQKALELLRRGIVKRVIVDVRESTSQVAIMLREPRGAGAKQR